MSAATEHDQQPLPPPEGWRLLKAAEVLCPRPAALYQKGGEALDAAIGTELHRLSAQAIRNPALRADAWLTLQLTDVLRHRPDLQLAGRSLFDPNAPLTRLQPDIILAACERDNGDDTVFRRWVHFDFRQDLVTTGHDVPPTHFNTAQPTTLMDMRIFASSKGMEPSASSDSAQGGKPEFGRARCRLWFRVRVDGWPKDTPPPTAKECLAAARAHFAGHIPRDLFRAIRRETVPSSWQRPGPRAPRN